MRAPKRAIRSATPVGSRQSQVAIRSPGTGPGPWRSRMLGGVRTASQTFAAPPSASSWAISIPELPGPTTSTRLPANGARVAVLGGVE